jgi:hypothetical protein
MQNLEQIRAAAALEPAKELSRAAVNKLPALRRGGTIRGTRSVLPRTAPDNSGNSRREKGQPAEVLVDYTGGTKTMSAALVLAAIELFDQLTPPARPGAAGESPTTIAT